MNNKKHYLSNKYPLILLLINFPIIGGLFCLAAGSAIPIVEGRLKITILYDNYIFTEGTKSDWGFSCLVEGTEKTILFDTGMKPEVLQHNIEKLKIDLSKIDLVAISHNHLDHIGGLPVILKEKPDIQIFIPDSLPEEFLKQIGPTKDRFALLEKPYELCKGVLLTGALGDTIKEQSLIINTSKGLVLITGCAHPGIINIIKKAKELRGRNIYLVLGGFHLLTHTDEQLIKIVDEMKALGVKKCSAGHCTGDNAIKVLKKAFLDDFIETGTGKTIMIE